MGKKFLCDAWKKRNERLNDGGASIKDRNGATSQKRCVVTGQTTKASDK